MNGQAEQLSSTLHYPLANEEVLHWSDPPHHGQPGQRVPLTLFGPQASKKRKRCMSSTGLLAVRGSALLQNATIPQHQERVVGARAPRFLSSIHWHESRRLHPELKAWQVTFVIDQLGK
eukprot:TRINITY_DN17086_c0_g3_i1.p1 TRINITY_DN17086_c0_g3~~TRINITY_DN17086_c0_g3_i1.p1  ORF type:complete len:119 (+),score=4.96 TRINITY_DN17086_c0_g3_i1:102-458(+)